ncbi:MAG: metalloregulator ArsR/SmtB family transcription factor [Planctomycetes bacterium]|nr:metalloregulator ArsR/SmtB family transcription factor [Planctomycetota bacterium]
MFDTLSIVKALADENRLRILMALRGKELCVCTLTELLDLSPSTTSRHLSILKQARLIESVKDGKFVYYRLVMPESPSYPLAGPALAWLDAALAESSQVTTDAALLRGIIERGEAGLDQRAVNASHQLYRHVPGIHAIGDFGEKTHA